MKADVNKIDKSTYFADLETMDHSVLLPESDDFDAVSGAGVELGVSDLEDD